VCAKEIKKELNTLDEADFVRDVANRDYHYLSQVEIDGAKRIYQHLSKSDIPRTGLSTLAKASLSTVRMAKSVNLSPWATGVNR
jgi:hypothetical protein